MLSRLVVIATIALGISVPMAQAQYNSLFTSDTAQGSDVFNAPGYGCNTDAITGDIVCQDLSGALTAGTIYAAAWGYGNSGIATEKNSAIMPVLSGRLRLKG